MRLPVRTVVVVAVLLVGATLAGQDFVRTQLLNSLLFNPDRAWNPAAAPAGSSGQELTIATDDGERLHGLFVRSTGRPRRGHALLFHGNGGNISYQLEHARALASIGLDVLVFDYRGYGQSSGRPTEPGTALDSRAALGALLDQPGVDPERVLYVGESLGGAIATALAVERPPRALVLLSTFISIRTVSRIHYPWIPNFLVPDAYPTIRRIATLNAPLLIVHGTTDEVIPLDHGRELFAAAPEPKRLEVVEGIGHGDIVSGLGPSYGALVGGWLDGVLGDGVLGDGVLGDGVLGESGR